VNCAYRNDEVAAALFNSFRDIGTKCVNRLGSMQHTWWSYWQS